MGELDRIAELLSQRVPTDDEWSDWKCRRIAPDKLLVQRAVNRYLFEVVDGAVKLMDYPYLDDVPFDGMPEHARAALDAAEGR